MADIFATLSTTFQNWYAAVMTVSGAYQVVIVLVAAIIAFIAHTKWQKLLQTRLGPTEQQGIMRLALRSSARVVFPLVMLLFILVGQAILKEYKYETQILTILSSLLISLATIRFLVYLLRRAFGQSRGIKAWEGIISTTIWFLVALHLLGWLQVILAALDGIGITLGESRVSILSVSKLILFAGLFIVVASWVAKLIEERARKSEFISASMRVALSKVSKVLLYTIAIVVALNSVGIDLTTLTVFGGALGVGLGFGFQRIASNFISGFILLFDRSIKPGDVISVGNRFGWVVQLNARYIVVRDREGVETLIPNENLITSEVTNWSFSDRHVRVKLPVQISYDDDPEFAMGILIKACEANVRVLKSPAPQARLLSFGDNGIDLELRLWLNDPQNGIGAVKSDVNLAIWKGFKENGITIPFPQRDVRVIPDK
ncbi:MAG: mechanosensitive ion channel family protein [Gammaproteobacteria bacterium]